MTVKFYGERDLMALDMAGGYYCRHVSAMTSEELHSKSDIAAELGWRDMQITELQRKVESLAVENNALISFIKDECWIIDDIEDSCIDAAKTMPETPATVAELAEIRAQGVEIFINENPCALGLGVIKSLSSFVEKVRSGTLKLEAGND